MSCDVGEVTEKLENGRKKEEDDVEKEEIINYKTPPLRIWLEALTCLGIVCFGKTSNYLSLV